MNRLRSLTPIQIIAVAVAFLIFFAVISYFVVTSLTTTKPPEATAPTAPQDLNSQANQKTLNALGFFEEPDNLPLVTRPLQTPDPNTPSNVNPFRP